MVALPLIAAGAALVVSVAAKAGKPPPGFGRFLGNLAGAPVDYLGSLGDAATGKLSNRFNLGGPFSFAADLGQNIRYVVENVLPSISAMQSSIGPSTEFSFFSNGEGLKSAEEAARHTASALCLWGSESLKAGRTILKATGTINTTTESVLLSTEGVLNNIRIAFLPRVIQAGLSV
jgi:hypothetical protein